MVALLLSGSNSSAVTLAWDANTEPDLAGYKIHLGPSSGQYGNTQDVGNVTQATIDIISNSYIAVTAYDVDNNESGYSNEIYYEIQSIQPASGGQIWTVEIEAEDEYDVLWYNGSMILRRKGDNAVLHGW